MSSSRTQQTHAGRRAIPALRERDYRGGPVEVVRPLGGEDYERSVIAYPSTGLRITGVMTVLHRPAHDHVLRPARKGTALAPK